MARNRTKGRAGAVRFVQAAKAVLLCALIGGSGIGYVLQKKKLHDLGRQITRREVVLERLKWENKLRANQLANLQLPQKLADRVRDQRLGLVPPQPGQVVWLPEPLAEKTSAPAPATAPAPGAANLAVARAQ